MRALWRQIVDFRRAFPQKVRLDPSPTMGMRSFTMPLKLEDWPEETPEWVKERLGILQLNGTWVMRESLLWLVLSPLDGSGEIRGEVQYDFGSQPGFTKRTILMEAELEAGEEALPHLQEALRRYFEQDHSSLRTILSLPDEVLDTKPRGT